MKQYTCIVRDHSYSMNSLRHQAEQDYNAQLQAAQASSNELGMEIIISVIKCGVGQKPGTREAYIEREVVTASVHSVSPMAQGSYIANGASTPLFDAVGEAISVLSSVPDAGEAAFLVQVITDGMENSSSAFWKKNLPEKIRELQGTDRWTFAFRVPRGYGKHLTRIGIYEGNILEWDQTRDGIRVAQTVNVQAMSSYYDGVSKGELRSRNFYSADLRNVSSADIKQSLCDITGEVVILDVRASDVAVGAKGAIIENFCRSRLGEFRRGSAFYLLNKKEKVVQGNKLICIRDKSTGKVHTGVAARQILGFPGCGNITVSPGILGKFEVFIQSTSNNRILPVGSKLIIWSKQRLM